jgi:hypothetical protein
MFEGATGVRHDGVVYREVWDDDGPTQVKFMAYWCVSAWKKDPSGGVIGVQKGPLW